MDYFAASIFIMVLVWVAARILYVRWRGVVTTGTIISQKRRYTDDGAIYSPVVAFLTTEGVRIEAEGKAGVNASNTPFCVDEQVSIRYLADDPKRFHIVRHEMQYTLWLSLFALFAVAVALFCYHELPTAVRVCLVCEFSKTIDGIKST